MVDNEDTAEQISFFAQAIKDANKKLKEMGIDEGVQCYFHAGETHKRSNQSFNIIDSILFNTKRIGHGFQLQ